MREGPAQCDGALKNRPTALALGSNERRDCPERRSCLRTHTLPEHLEAMREGPAQCDDALTNILEKQKRSNLTLRDALERAKWEPPNTDQTNEI